MSDTEKGGPEDEYDLEEETELEEGSIMEGGDENELDLEEDYLNRLKTQRKRIEELSSLHLSNEDKLNKEIERNHHLKEDNDKLIHLKEIHIKYNDILQDYQLSTQQNNILKEQVQDLKQELLQTVAEKSQIILKLRNQLALQKDKVAYKVENLEEALSIREEQFEKCCKQFKMKEKDFQDNIFSLKESMVKLKQQNDGVLTLERNKMQKLSRQFQSKVYTIAELQTNLQGLLKENSQMKEEIFRLSSKLSSRELEQKNSIEKYKMKMGSMKKEMKQKDKENMDLKESSRKHERQRLIFEEENHDLKNQIKKQKEQEEQTIKKIEAEISLEKRNLQTLNSQHLVTIEDLVQIKNDLTAENKKLMQILKKKEVIEKQRKQLLRTELKEIDKLEKVIDRIID